MKKLGYLWVKYGTSNNQRALWILLVLSALAVAAGAPGAGSGVGGSGGLSIPFMP